MDIAGLAIFFIGWLASFIGGIMLLVAAFSTSVLWGLGFLFVPVVNLLFVIMHWGRAKRGFLVSLAGTGIAMAGVALVIVAGPGPRTAMFLPKIGAPEPDSSKLPQASRQPEPKPGPMDLMGSSLEEAKRQFGKPEAQVTRAGKVTWLYEGFMIVSADGQAISKVILDKDFEPISRKLPPVVSKSGPPLVTNHADVGKPVDLNSLMTNGYINIVSFYATSKPKSRVLCNDLVRLTREFQGVVLRKVDVVTDDSRCARQHEVKQLPDVRIYDARGNEVGRTTSYSEASLLVRKALPTLPTLPPERK